MDVYATTAATYNYPFSITAEINGVNSTTLSFNINVVSDCTTSTLTVPATLGTFYVQYSTTQTLNIISEELVSTIVGCNTYTVSLYDYDGGLYNTVIFTSIYVSSGQIILTIKNTVTTEVGTYLFKLTILDDSNEYFTFFDVVIMNSCSGADIESYAIPSYIYQISSYNYYIYYPSFWISIVGCDSAITYATTGDNYALVTDSKSYIKIWTDSNTFAGSLYILTLTGTINTNGYDNSATSSYSLEISNDCTTDSIIASS